MYPKCIKIKQTNNRLLCSVITNVSAIDYIGH